MELLLGKMAKANIKFRICNILYVVIVLCFSNFISVQFVGWVGNLPFLFIPKCQSK